MGNTTIKLIFIFFALSYALTSCRDHDKCDDCVSICDSSNTVFLPQDLKDYFSFKEGSYWVYKDSISGEIDSIRIKKAVLKIGIEPQRKENCNEVYTCSFASLFYGNWSYQIEPNGSKVEEIYSVLFLNIDNGVIIYRFEYTKNAFVDDNAEGGVVSKIDSININGRNYKDILNLDYLNPTLKAEYFKTAYYAPQVGLVKCITQDGKVWELVRVHVNL